MPVERMERTGPELVDERLAYHETLRVEGADTRITGEAGLEHLRRSVAGIVVPKVRWAESLTVELSHMRGIRNVRCVSYRAGLKRKRGHYDRAMGDIVLFGVPRLATLLHEWAHHSVGARYATNKKMHGREFKGELRWAYRAIESIAGLDLSVGVRAAAMSELRDGAAARAVRVPYFTPGTRVRVKGMAGVGTVRRKLRKNYVVSYEHKSWRVPPQLMEKA